MVTKTAASAAPAQRMGDALRALLRAGRGMQSATARKLSLGETDLMAMDELVTSPALLGPVELGHRLGIRSASATVLVDRLEAAGHVRRQPHPSDRRRLVLQTSESAKAEIRQTLTPMLIAMGKITGRLAPGEAEVVLTFLRDVTAAMNDFAAVAAASAPAVQTAGGTQDRASRHRREAGTAVMGGEMAAP